MVTVNTVQPALRPPAKGKAIKSQPLFGQNANDKDSCCNVPKPAANNKASASTNHKILNWVLTALLGAGVSGSYVQNQMLHNTMQKDNAAIRNQIKDLSSRVSLDQIVKVVSKVTPSTVRVEGSAGLGSGVIIKDNMGRMFILTNGHVTDQNDIHRFDQKDNVYHIKLYNGSDNEAPIEFDAAPVVLSNGNRAESLPYIHDLALLQIPPDVRLPKNVKPVEMRNTTQDPLKVGETVVAVGNPYALKDAVSSGIISHVDRNFDLEPENRFIQTDAPINPGNSGGGLFDMQGRLIGINTLGYRGADGLAGSIRIDVIKSVIESWGVPVLASGEKAVKFPQGNIINQFINIFKKAANNTKP